MSPANATFDNLPDEKRERVLAEATREFAEHGYHQASVNRIVSRLGIAKGSLFKYFGNKQGLFECLFERSIDRLKRPLKAIRDDADADFFRSVERSLLAGAAFIDAHPFMYRIYLKMLHQEDFPLRERFLGQIHGASHKFLHALVAKGVASGQLRRDLDPDMAVYHIEAVMDRYLQTHALPGLGDEHLPSETKAQAVTEFLRSGLGALPQ